jgi:hypothetical protein
MSLSELPEDAHTVVLKYLTLYDIANNYQLTCKNWFDIAKTRVIQIDSVYVDDENFDDMMKIINSRYPNVEELDLNDQLLLIPEEPTQNLKDCHNLRLLRFGTKMYIPRLDILEGFYSIFPKYAAICPSYAEQEGTDTVKCTYWPYERFNKNISTEVIERAVKHQNITCVLFNSESMYKPIADAILPSAARTMTELHIVESNGIKTAEKLLSYMLPVSNLKHIRVDSNTSEDWVEVIKRSPQLLSYNGPVDKSHITAIIDHCPNFEQLVTTTPDIETLTLITTKIRKLKDLEVESFPSGLTENITSLETLTFRKPYLHGRSPIADSIDHIKTLKHLYGEIHEYEIFRIPGSLLRLETIEVHSGLHASVAKRLMNECPRLRFIIGVHKRVKAPRVADEECTIDVVQWRADCAPKNPSKRRKTTK